MKSTDLLMSEHRLIERMLNVLSNYTIKLEQGKKVPPENLKMCVDFIRTFADTYHHLKEEDILFAEMEAFGMPRNGGPVGVMLSEHEMGRRFTKAMTQAAEDYEKGNNGAAKAFAENARNYVGLLSQHISKEDGILYPMANQMLGDMDDQIMEQFDEKKSRLGERVREKYEGIVTQLEKDSSS